MDRLLNLLLIQTLVIGVAGAQESAQQYSVVGDVRQPQTYEFDGGSSVCIHDVLQKSGAIEAGVAVVLRGSPLTVVGQEQVNPAYRQRGSVLAPGDVVLFRSASGLIPGRPNAVVLFQDCRAELPLEQGVRSVAGLLQQLRIDTSHRVAVMRSEWDRANLLSLSGSEDIQHADVVDLSNIPVASMDITQLFESVPAKYVRQNESMANGSLVVKPVSNGGDTFDLFVPEHDPPTVQMQLITSDTVERESDSGSVEPRPFRSASLETVVEDIASPVTSAVKFDERTLQADSSGSVVLNTIFISGLLFAMGLILVGWIRTQREQEIANQIPQSVRNSLGSEPVSTTVNADAVAIVKKESPELSVGLEQSVSQKQRASIPDLNVAAWYSSENEQPTSVDEFVGPPRPLMCETSESPKSTAATEAWNDLEDLIQNRMPVELRKADLPLKVALFGRPAGPQRLRIDAAHTQISPPHMLSRQKSDSKRRPLAATVQEKESQSRTVNAATAADRDSKSPDVSRLDRALNFLEEQSDA